jgi:putative pyoverdin transport system ATP-binding/permease protein
MERRSAQAGQAAQVSRRFMEPDRAKRTTILSLLFRTSAVRFIGAILAGVTAGIAGTILIMLINRALSPGAHLGYLAIWFSVTACGLLTARVFSQLMLAQISQSRLYDLRMMVCQRIVDTPLHRLEDLGPGRLFCTLTQDIDIVEQAMLAFPGFCVDVALSIGCFSYQAYLSWRFFLATFASLIAWMLFNHRFPFSIMKKAQERARNASDTLYDHYNGIISGIKELKLNAHRRRHYLGFSLAETAKLLRRQNIVTVNAQSFADSLQQLMYLGVVAILLFGVGQYAPRTTLTGFVLTLLYLELYWNDVIRFSPTLVRANIALERIDGLARELSEVDNLESSTQSRCGPFSTLTLRGIQSTYLGGHFRLGPINLTMCAGEIVIVAGGNGSGKTTFAKTLTGLYAAEAGEILVNGRVLDNEGHRALFSAVFSDSHLFDQLPAQRPMPLVQAYLAKLKLDHKVAFVDGRLSTTALSSGQRRRLMLLMAWLEDRPIYVLDEWAADQDPEFRSTFYFEILPELRRCGKLVIVISHDERFFHVADRLVRLDCGQLIEETVSHREG